jgi:hypothetical protein
MKGYVLFRFVILLVFLISACAPVASPAAQPTRAGGFYPLTTRTNNEEIDNLLDAVASGDQQKLQSLVQFTDAVCTRLDGLGGPPRCWEGETEGTPVEVLPFLSSEGSFLRRNEIEKWPALNVLSVYAIYQVSPALVSEQYFPAGEYVIVLLGSGNEPPVALRTTDGRIVRVDYILDPAPEALDALLQREALNLILAPKN